MTARKNPLWRVTEGEWIGNQVRHWRELLGLRQADVAAVLTEELGVPWTQSAIANIEKGKRVPSLVEVLALCIVFGVTLNDFLYNADGLDDAHELLMPDGSTTIVLYALGEVLDDGLTGSTADSWSGVSGSLDVSKALEAVEALRGDPEFRALKETVGMNNDERLRELIDQVYREEFADRGKGRRSARDLVDAWQEYLAGLDPSKKYDTPHAKRALRAHARANAADDIIRKVMGEQ